MKVDAVHNPGLQPYRIDKLFAVVLADGKGNEGVPAMISPGNTLPMVFTNPATRICFANGQKCAHADDPWAVSEQTLTDYRRGQWDEPGPALAERLWRIALPAMIAKYGMPNLELGMKLMREGKLPEPKSPYD